MASSQRQLPHVCIDGKWFPCQPAGEFGVLGEREIYELVADATQLRRFLIRQLGAAQGKSATKNDGRLGVQTVSTAGLLPLREVTLKTYQYATPSESGKLEAAERHFLQQEVTGLLTLREAILKKLHDGQPEQVWVLFHSACKALNTFTKSVGQDRLVALQCPTSLAVEARTGKIIPLDAELQAPALSGATEAAFLKWFGTAGKARNVLPQDASLLHSKALLLFFLETLGWAPTASPAAAGARTKPLARLIPQKMATQLDQLAVTRNLDDLQLKLEEIVEDWSLIVEQDVPLAQMAPVSPERRDAGPSQQPWFTYFVGSSLLNLLLLLLLLIFGGLLLQGCTSRNKGEDGGGEKPPVGLGMQPVDPSLQFPPYCVVFPDTHAGTLSQTIEKSLKQLFPGKVIPPAEQKDLEETRLNAAVKSLTARKDIEPLLKVLMEKGLQFTHYAQDDPQRKLKVIIESGGSYHVNKKAYGSLLLVNAVDRILEAAGLAKDGPQRPPLEAMRKAAVEYAALNDTLALRSGRQAFLIEVEPTAEAHSQVRKTLLNHPDLPVFVPRPLTHPFDSITSGGGDVGGFAEFRLTEESDCYWRLVSKSDREGINWKKTKPNELMNWKYFRAPKAEIKWSAIGVYKRGYTNVASFDIAVVDKTKAVIFRDQQVFLSKNKDDVRTFAEDHLKEQLKFNLPVDQVLKINPEKEGFTAAFRYSFLAEQAVKAQAGSFLEIQNREDFEKKTMPKEDMEGRKP